MSSWHSYPKIFTLGHKAIQDLLKGNVTCEEKVDGSQFSFGWFNIHRDECNFLNDGIQCQCEQGLRVRSKGAVMHPDAPEKMFSKGVEHVKSIQHLLHPNWTYRGEYLAKPKHNALAYDRVPNGHIILFDVTTDEESYLEYDDKVVEASRLGLEVVPRLFEGKINTIEEFRTFLTIPSVLGGQLIEGVVVKPKGYGLFGLDKKVLLGKFVSEAFKEVHSLNWKSENPSSKDIIAMIGDAYGTPARWNKSIQHLREAGVLIDSPKDIGAILKEIPNDVLKECEDEMKEKLFSHAWPHIRRMLTREFPQYYKDLLLKKAFEDEDVQASS